MTVNVVPTPFSKHGLLYLSSGYPGGRYGPSSPIRPGAAGDISLKPGETSNQHVAWFQPLLGTYQTSALVYGDYYYTLLDRGLLLCHDAKTGKQIYGRQRISPEAGGFTASPWAYNGKVFVLSEDGDTFVVQAGPGFKLLGKNTLNEMALASPAWRGAASSSHAVDALSDCEEAVVTPTAAHVSSGESGLLRADDACRRRARAGTAGTPRASRCCTWAGRDCRDSGHSSVCRAGPDTDRLRYR